MIDRIAARLDPHEVRLHVWIVGLVVFAACQDAGPNLSESTSELITTSPATSYAFPTVQVGSSSGPAGVTVSPSGQNSYDTIVAVYENCPDFSVNAPGLPADVYRVCEYYDECGTGGQICPLQTAAICSYWDIQTYYFTVTFTPQVAASTSCVVNVQTQAGQTRSITFTGTGSPPPIDIDVQPTAIGFGDVRRATTSTAANLTVRNLGGGTLAVNSVGVTGPFQLSGATSYQVAPGGAISHAITCTPPTVGAHTGTVTISSNDPSTPTINVPLSCRGIDSNLDITPSPAQLPTTRVGEPITHTVTLRNSGGASMSVQSVTLTGNDLTMVSAPDPGTTLGPGATATAQVRFGATASGDVAGMLTVTYDGGQARSTTLSARALSTSMAMTPDGNVDLGAVCIGATKEQEFSVIANDQGGFRITELTAPSAPFEINNAPNLPASVAGAGANQVAFTVRAAPTAEGAATSSVRVTTDIPGATPRDIQVAVVGLAAGVSATPAQLDFGANAIDTTTIGQDVHVTNCATSPVTLANARIEGPDAAEFAIVQQPNNLTVATGASVQWLVVAQPRSPGEKMASFVVDGPDGPVSMQLIGDGIGEGPDGPGTPGGVDVPPSYYACSTGGAAGASPLVLVLALVLRRRRR